MSHFLLAAVRIESFGLESGSVVSVLDDIIAGGPGPESSVKTASLCLHHEMETQVPEAKDALSVPSGAAMVPSRSSPR